MSKHVPKLEAPNGEVPGSQARNDEISLRRLTPTERKRLDIDSWEPSLLRALLEAHNELPADEA
jgi:hypothetical protein